MALTIQQFRNAAVEGKVTLQENPGQQPALVRGKHSTFGHIVKQLIRSKGRTAAKEANKATIRAFIDAVRTEHGQGAASRAADKLNAHLEEGKPLSKSAIKRVLDYKNNFGAQHTGKLHQQYMNAKKAELSDDLRELAEPKLGVDGKAPAKHTAVDIGQNNPVLIHQVFKGDCGRNTYTIGTNAPVNGRNEQNPESMLARQLHQLTGGNAWATRDISQLLSQHMMNTVFPPMLAGPGLPPTDFPFPQFPQGGERPNGSSLSVSKDDDGAYLLTFRMETNPTVMSAPGTANGRIDLADSTFTKTLSLRYVPAPGGNGPGTVDDARCTYSVKLNR